MILVDPDFAPHPAALQSRAQKPASAQIDPTERVPSLRTLSRFLSQAQQAVRLKGQVTVLLTGDQQIRKLNRQFRGKNKATDVLSFPAMPGLGGEDTAGDLAISVATASRQAGEQGHPLATELKVLMLHGLLHLAGYDHETDEGQMARRERLLRARLKLPQGLIERVDRASEDAPAPARKKRKTASPAQRTRPTAKKKSPARAGKKNRPLSASRTKGSKRSSRP